MKVLSRGASLAASIAAALTMPTVSAAHAQSPENHAAYTDAQPEVVRASTNADGGAAIGIWPALVAGSVSRGTGRSELLVPGVARTLSTAQSTVLRVDNEMVSHKADNWRRARTVGYTLGAVAVCFAAFVFYSVVTGT